MIWTLADSFWDFHLGDVVSAILVVIALGTYLYTRKHDEEAVAQRHAENTVRLESLLQFRENQEELNRKRDEQITQLKVLAESQIQIVKSQDRRLEMIEDEIRENRKRPS